MHYRHRCRQKSRQITLAVILAVLLGGPNQASGQGTDGVRMIVPGGEAQDYWPRWRGPSGQGLVEGTGYPDSWSDTENVIWKVTVPGEGASSPIVWADQIFLTTADDRAGTVSVLSFRRSDGERLRCQIQPVNISTKKTPTRRPRSLQTVTWSTRRSAAKDSSPWISMAA